MNAESLLGTVLGTCTLQKLIGQGGMGAVYLAQQSRPRRQVAVKVLLPATPLKPEQRAAFLERFRRETDAAASLEHLNIMPVHEYGERDGLAYLVMPYVSGGTLRDEMVRERQFPFAKVMNYLDQMAAALNVAHERGIIHRDVKPANILITPEKRLLLSDFGLVKIAAEGQSAHTRLTREGAPLGTPDYMAPEQVMGDNVDARADLYSLGIILYQMVTGTTPFKGDLPMQIAMQHLQIPPQPPAQLRPDLPASAEQAILRALAKRPVDRYMHAQDLANAFRVALTAANIPLEGMGGLLATNTPQSRLFTPRGLFDPSWQATAVARAQQEQNIQNAQVASQQLPTRNAPPASPFASTERAGMLSMLPPLPNQTGSAQGGDIVAQTSMTLPSFTGLLPPTAASPASPVLANPGMTTMTTLPKTLPIAVSTNVSEQGASPVAEIRGNTPLPPLRNRLGVKANLLRPIPTSNPDVTPLSPTQEEAKNTSSPMLGQQDVVATPPLKPHWSNTISPFTGTMSSTFPLTDSQPGADVTGTWMAPGVPGNSSTGQGMTGTFPIANSEYPEQGSTMTMKLTQSVKIVKVPVAGQPGHYVTGLLPALPKTPEPRAAPILPTLPERFTTKIDADYLKKNRNKLMLALAALMLVLGSSLFFVIRAHSGPTTTNKARIAATPNVAATVTAQARATADANIIFSDPLSANTHNWPVSVNANGPKAYVFMNGAYYITATDPRSSSVALLPPDEPLPQSFVYTLSLAEVHGDDASINNQFGMLMRFSLHQKSGKTSITFYAFEVVNMKNGEYQFWKYDNNYGAATNPWTKLWSTSLGHEYHFAHGSGGLNTFRVTMAGPKFTFSVNGKQLGKAQDGSFVGGQIGMLVNLQGTQVAFSNLLLTYN